MLVAAAIMSDNLIYKAPFLLVIVNFRVAERGGFEPPVRFLTVRRFSKPLLSTTQPSLRVNMSVVSFLVLMCQRDFEEIYSKKA